MTDKTTDTTPATNKDKSKPLTKLDKPKGTQTIVNPQYDEKPDPDAIIPFGTQTKIGRAHV